MKSQKVATYLRKYRSRTSDNLWKAEERQNDTRVVVGGCGIKTRRISNSDKLHKKYKQTDATRREHRRGQPTLATSPTCALGNPEDTYYLHFLVILNDRFFFFLSAHSIHSKRCNWPDHWQITDFNSRFSQCCML